MLILNGLYCDTIFVTEYYGVAWWTKKNFNNSLKCGRRITDNTHSQLACAERTHTVCTLHVHLLQNFARLIANLLFMLRAFVQDVFRVSISVFVLEDLSERKKNKKISLKKSSYLIDAWRLWMRPIEESHFVLLCEYFPPNQLTAEMHPHRHFCVQTDSSCWKAACCLKSKYKI